MATAAQRMENIATTPVTDPRWVLEDDITMPESDLHDEILRLLVDILVAWVQREGRDASVRRNMALRWDRRLPQVGVDPDVMLIEPAPPGGTTLRSVCTWKPGHHPPRVAIEVVSEKTASKDYREGPLKYAANGTRELWVFDPERLGPRGRGGPFLLQLWRRDTDGRFARCYAGEGPVRSEELGSWLVVTEAGKRLRIAEDSAGQRLWLTVAEAALAREHDERRAKEAAIAREESTAEENERLRAEIGRLRSATAGR